jgi:hypothetical protein
MIILTLVAKFGCEDDRISTNVRVRLTKVIAASGNLGWKSASFSSEHLEICRVR